MATNRTDADVRAALLPQLRTAHPEALLVQEWGIGYQLFADVAAIGTNAVWAWEIKSDADSTARLARQVPLYSELFTYCTVVSAPRHLLKVREIVPAAWGITVAAEAEIYVEREAQRNDGALLVNLLWADEVKKLAQRFKVRPRALEIQRAEYAKLAAAHPGVNYGTGPKNPGKAHVAAALAELPRETLAPLVCEALRARKDWRREDGFRSTALRDGGEAKNTARILLRTRGKLDVATLADVAGVTVEQATRVLAELDLAGEARWGSAGYRPTDKLRGGVGEAPAP